jgi:hypothetical protein
MDSRVKPDDWREQAITRFETPKKFRSLPPRLKLTGYVSSVQDITPGGWIRLMARTRATPL